MSTVIRSTTGAYGRGDYAHTCYRPTFCCEAGGTDNACGGYTTYTPTVEGLAARIESFHAAMVEPGDFNAIMFVSPGSRVSIDVNTAGTYTVSMGVYQARGLTPDHAARIALDWHNSTIEGN